MLIASATVAEIQDELVRIIQGMPKTEIETYLLLSRLRNTIDRKLAECDQIDAAMWTRR